MVGAKGKPLCQWLMDWNRTLWCRYGVTAAPETFVVDRFWMICLSAPRCELIAQNWPVIRRPFEMKWCLDGFLLYNFWFYSTSMAEEWCHLVRRWIKTVIKVVEEKLRCPKCFRTRTWRIQVQVCGWIADSSTRWLSQGKRIKEIVDYMVALMEFVLYRPPIHRRHFYSVWPFYLSRSGLLVFLCGDGEP